MVSSLDGYEQGTVSCVVLTIDEGEAQAVVESPHSAYKRDCIDERTVEAAFWWDIE